MIEGNKIRSLRKYYLGKERRKKGRKEAGKKELLLMILKENSSTQVGSDQSKPGGG